MAEKISKKIFYIIVATLPLNLGYHFVIKKAYIDGMLVDYLIPVIYVQDILVLVFLILNLSFILKNLNKLDKYLVWFLFTVFLTSVRSVFFLSSFTLFLRLFIYTSFMFVVSVKYAGKEVFKKIVYIFGWVVIFLSILAFAQWIRQGSVFNNYFMFGEQPYTSATPGINLENFFGTVKVPPYSTFRHPNIFAGILSIVLVWFLFYMEEIEFLKISYLFGLIALFLTLSKFSWLSFLIGVIYFLFQKLQKQKTRNFFLAAMVILLATSLFLPFVRVPSRVYNKPSFYRRADLLESSYELISQNTLFGVGYGLSPAYIYKRLPSRHDLRFIQPTHNIFVLIFLESGVFALLFFTLFLFKKIRRSLNKKVIFISLIQIIFLGMFDHYFFTIHQPQLLFWVILGFV